LRLRIVFSLGCGFAFVAVVAACGWDWTVVPKASSDAGNEKDASNGSCSSTKDCPLDEFCRFDDLLCGADQPGVCKKTEGCAPQPGLACGCDGHVYSSDCEAFVAGVDVTFKACTPPSADAVQCGAYFCGQTSFCFQGKSCIGWKCDERTCACARAETESDCPDAACEEDPGGTFVTCK